MPWYSRLRPRGAKSPIPVVSWPERPPPDGGGAPDPVRAAHEGACGVDR